MLNQDVTRRKFKREVAVLMENRTALRERRIFIEEVAFPHVYALFSVGFRLGPIVSFGVQLGFEDYNVLPPSALFVEPVTRRPLLRPEIPASLNLDGEHSANVIVGAHPETGFPFICLRGFREYHTHPQHTDDPWDRYRYDGSTGTAYYCLEQIWLHLTSAAQAVIQVQVGVARQSAAGLSSHAQ